MLVVKLMRPAAVTCRPEDTLESAAQLMLEHDLGCLPVVDAEGRLAGVITDRDAVLAVYARRVAFGSVRVEAAMARNVITCTIHDDVAQVEHWMATHKIRRIPVVDEAGKPIGVVTLSDVARAALRGHDVSSKGVTSVRRRSPS